jgi:suppressor of tumorigenicity protein 13
MFNLLWLVGCCIYVYVCFYGRQRFKETPGILKVPELSFFWEFLEEYGSSLGQKVSAADDGFFDDSIPPPLEDVDPSSSSSPVVDSTQKRAMKKEKPKEKVDVKKQTKEAETEKKTALPSSIDRSVCVTSSMRELAQEEKGKGIQAMKQKKFGKALEHFTKSIQNNPQSALLWCKRAGCFFAMNAFQSAIDDAYASSSAPSASSASSAPSASSASSASSAPSASFTLKVLTTSCDCV